MIMLFGGSALLVGLIWLPLGQIWAWLAWVFLRWTILAVQWTASWPGVGTRIEDVPGWIIWAY